MLCTDSYPHKIDIEVFQVWPLQLARAELWLYFRHYYFVGYVVLGFMPVYPALFCNIWYIERHAW